MGDAFIAQLTAEQRERLPEWVRRWVERGRSVERVDHASVEAGIRACYRFAGLNGPDAILWVPSPLAGVLEWPRVMRARHPSSGRHSVHALPLAAEVLERLEELPPELLFGSTLDEEIASSLGDEVLASISRAIGEEVGAESWFQIWSAVNAEVGWAIDEEVSKAVDEVLERQARLGAPPQRHWMGRFGGAWWCAFQAWSSFFRDVCALSLPGDLWERDEAFAAAQSASWWWPHRRFVLVCERPTQILLDEEGRLHCTNGPAIRWSDGWGLWFWHGVRVDEPNLDRCAEPTYLAVAR